MSDAQLQTLKRAWEASQVLEDEVAYLHEALRAGVLSSQRLNLAAHCGGVAAARCLNLSPELLTRNALMTLLSELEPATDARLCVAVGRAAMEVLAQLEGDEGPRFDVSLIAMTCDAVEAWILDPSPLHRERVESASNACHTHDLRPIRRSPHTAWMVTQPVFSPVANSAAMILLHASGVLTNEISDPQTFPLIRPVLAREVVPWLLGYRDPLAERLD